MSKDNNCNLIEDLLPLYVEGLVSEKTKIDIEEHLKKCDKCSEILKSINKNNELFLSEEVITKEQNYNKEKEIKCIKNIKKKIIFRLIIAIVITILTTITIFGIYILGPYRFVKDENGKLILYNSSTGNIEKGMEATNLIATYTYNDNGKDIEYYIVLTFDKNDVCINARTIISGYGKSELSNFKNAWENSNAISNIKIENQKLYMNENSYIGKNKQRLIETLKTSYNAQVIEI